MPSPLAMEAADADTNTKSFKDTGPAIRKFSSQPTWNRDARNPCYRRSRTSHILFDCKFKDATCNHCGKKGHISPVCCSKAKSQQPPSVPGAPTRQGRHGRNKQCSTHRVQETAKFLTSDTEGSSGEEYRLYQMTNRASEPFNVPVLVNGKKLTMELDTGAAFSIISNQTWRSQFPDLQLRNSSLVLKTYTDELMQVVGQLNVRVKYRPA